jgi:hypothetical protein
MIAICQGKLQTDAGYVLARCKTKSLVSLFPLRALPGALWADSWFKWLHFFLSERQATEGGAVARVIAAEGVGIRALRDREEIGEQLHRHDGKER